MGQGDTLPGSKETPKVMTHGTRTLCLLSTLTLGLVALACGGTSQEAPAPAPQAAAAPAPAPAPAPVEAAPVATDAVATDAAAAATPAAPMDAAAAEAILVTADAADGTTDKVVSKCAGCKLGMAGHADHAVQAHGYTLHFCSAECKAKAEGSMDATIAGLTN